MRIYTFEDKDAQQLLDTLKLEKYLDPPINDAKTNNLSAHEKSSLHRQFHYHVVNWLQAQGWK